MKKKLLCMALAAAMALGLCACGSDDGGTTDASTDDGTTSTATGAAFKIGGTGPLTGSASIYGVAAKNGAQIAVDEINALGGDIQLELMTEDDVNDAETSGNAYNALMDDGMQILVGTVTIESTETLSAALTKRGIAHEVHNAKHHEREAHIVAQAGRYGAVPIATTMAGRGTDILLGGNPDELVRERLEYEGLTMEDVTPEQLEQFNAEAKETCKAERERVLAAGGLTVIGTERHESRRIDNQLRGRSGRQGDPGETQFYLSLEDDLMRLFGGDRMDRVSKMMVTADMGDDMPIQHKIISKAVENAQHKVESINFSMRKSVLEYDDVMNKQRQVIYAERNKILDGKDLTDHITEVMHDTVYRCVQEFCTKDSHEGERELEGLR